MLWKANKIFVSSENKEEAKIEFLKQVEVIEKHLETCLQCLQFEEEASKEGWTHKAAKKALATVRDIRLFADFL